MEDTISLYRNWTVQRTSKKRSCFALAFHCNLIQSDEACDIKVKILVILLRDESTSVLKVDYFSGEHSMESI